MNESFRVGAALLLKTLYKNIALIKYHPVSKLSQSRVRRTSADLISTGASYYSGGPILELL
jgi:hypothetical protein